VALAIVLVVYTVPLLLFTLLARLLQSAVPRVVWLLIAKTAINDVVMFKPADGTDKNRWFKNSMAT
jgi:hypothetical protein